MDRRFTIALLATAGICPILLGAAAVVLELEPLFLLAILLCELYAPAALLLRHDEDADAAQIARGSASTTASSAPAGAAPAASIALSSSGSGIDWPRP